jgi:hypothetical protein
MKYTFEMRIPNLYNVNVITSTMLVLLKRGISWGHSWDALKRHIIHTKYYDDRFWHLSNINDITCYLRGYRFELVMRGIYMYDRDKALAGMIYIYIYIYIYIIWNTRGLFIWGYGVFTLTVRSSFLLTVKNLWPVRATVSVEIWTRNRWTCNLIKEIVPWSS